MNAVDAICSCAPHSNDAAKKAKQNAIAIQHHFGCPTFFLTVTPDDDNHISIQILSGKHIDFNRFGTSEMTDAFLSNRAKERNELRIKYPGICALFFELALNTIIVEVFGWNLTKKKQETLGLFGRIDAFTCSIEEQGRGTLHAHFLIWNSELNKKREELRFCKLKIWKSIEQSLFRNS